MSGPRGPDEPEHDWPSPEDAARESRDASSGADEAGWDDWSRSSRPPGPSNEPVSNWDDWPPPLELEPGSPPEPEPGAGDLWSETWEVEQPRYTEPGPRYREPEPPALPEPEPPPIPQPEPEPGPMPAAAREPWTTPWRPEPEEDLAPEEAPAPYAEAVAPPEEAAAPPGETLAPPEEAFAQPEEALAPRKEAASRPEEAVTHEEPVPYAAEAAPSLEAEEQIQHRIEAAEEEAAASVEPSVEVAADVSVELEEPPAPEATTPEVEAAPEESPPAEAVVAERTELPAEWTGGPEPEAEAGESGVEAQAPASVWTAPKEEPTPAPVWDAGPVPPWPREPELEPQPEPPAAAEPSAEAIADAEREPAAVPEPQAVPDMEPVPAAATVAAAADAVPEPSADVGPDAEPEVATAGDGAVVVDHGDAGLLEPAEGRIDTALAQRWPGIERRKPTTAESAVPWLIGIILLLTGMVVVLIALIFGGDASLAGVIDPSADASPSDAPTATTRPTPAPSPRPTATPEATPPPSSFGQLEMVFKGRSQALAPIYLLRDDFTTPDPATVLAQDPSLNVEAFDWAPDGSHGAALLADALVSIEPDGRVWSLATGIATLTFGDNPSSVYAVRITPAGANDTAAVFAIDYMSAVAVELASVPYVRPEIVTETPLKEAQFADEGGSIRLYRLADGTLRLWVMGAGAWQIDPGTGATTPVEGGALPVLWSPDSSHRIVVNESGTTSTLVMYHSGGVEIASTTVEGLVSHTRWSPGGSQVVFTLARGNVRQDLFVWDLDTDTAPVQATQTGAAFGAEWLGSPPVWKP